VYREQRIPPGEAQRILARALDMQRARGGGRDIGADDLQRICDELGVDAAVLRDAIAGKSDAEVSGEKSWLTGTPLRLAFDRRVPRAIDASDHPRVVEAIRRATQHHGLAGSVGDALEWSHGTRGRPNMRVTVTPSEDGTLVRVEQDLRGVAGGLFGGVLGGVGTNALVWAILGPAVFGVGLWLTGLLSGVIAVVYAVLYVAFGAYVGLRREALAYVVDAVAAEAAVAPPTARVAARARVADAAEEEAREDAGDVASERARRAR
jgi:hypothetical protein